MSRSNLKHGWWKVKFDISLFEGKEHKKVDVQFDDLSEITREHIISSIKEGFTEGEVYEDV
jgi:hypothetical protein